MFSRLRQRRLKLPDMHVVNVERFEPRYSLEKFTARYNERIGSRQGTVLTDINQFKALFEALPQNRRIMVHETCTDRETLCVHYYDDGDRAVALYGYKIIQMKRTSY